MYVHIALTHFFYTFPGLASHKNLLTIQSRPKVFKVIRYVNILFLLIEEDPLETGGPERTLTPQDDGLPPQQTAGTVAVS